MRANLQGSNEHNFESYNCVDSFDDLFNSAGKTYFQNLGKNVVWAKIVGEPWKYNPYHETFDHIDEPGYETFRVKN